MAQIKCPKCGSDNVCLHHRSIPVKRKRPDKLAGKVIQTVWYICNDCGFKFYREIEYRRGGGEYGL